MPAAKAPAKPITAEDVGIELLRRGVPPEELAKRGYGTLAQQWQSGLIGPGLDSPDPTAARQAYISDYKALGAQRKALGRFTSLDSQLQRFLYLNTKGEGGTWTGGVLNQIPGVKSVVTSMSPQLQEMNSIASILQGQARPPGSGSTSDFEQRLYRQGVPSPEALGPVNASKITYMRSVLQEERDRLQFQSAYLQRNQTLAGSDEAWAGYTQSNPYAVSTKSGMVLNPKRQAWTQYFGVPTRGAGQRQAAAPAPRPAAPKAGASGLTDAQLKAALGL